MRAAPAPRPAPPAPGPAPEPPTAPAPAPAPGPGPGPAPSAVEPKPSPGAGGDDPWSALSAWATGKAAAEARLALVRPVTSGPDELVVAPATPEGAGAARGALDWIRERLREATGRTVAVRFDGPGPEARAAEAPAPDDAGLRRAASENPIVRQAMDLFGARVVGVEKAPGAQEPPAPEAPERS